MRRKVTTTHTLSDCTKEQHSNLLLFHQLSNYQKHRKATRYYGMTVQSTARLSKHRKGALNLKNYYHDPVISHFFEVNVYKMLLITSKIRAIIKYIIL